MLMYFGWKQRPLACFQLFLDDDDNDIKKNMIDVRKHSGTKLIKNNLHAVCDCAN